MTRPARPFLWWIGALLAGVAVHGAAWFWLTSRLRDGAEAAVAFYGTQGWHASAGAPRRGGWPLAASLWYPRVTVTGPASWTAEWVDLRIALLRPGTLEIVPGGRQTFGVPGWPEVSGEAGRLVIATPLDGDGAADVAGADITLMLPAGPVLVYGISGRLGEADAALDLTGIQLPESWRLLEGNAERAGFRAVLVPSAPLGGTPAQRAARWRDSGGVLSVPGFEVRWGTFSVTGTGTLRLNARLQPEAEARLQVTGYAAMLDGAVRTGLLPPRSAAAAKTVLGLLGAPGGGTVDVPLVLQAGVLSVARFPLLRVPDLDWAGRYR